MKAFSRYILNRKDMECSFSVLSIFFVTHLSIIDKCIIMYLLIIGFLIQLRGKYIMMKEKKRLGCFSLVFGC